MIKGFIIDILIFLRNVLSFAWRAGVGFLFQMWLHSSINRTDWSGGSLGNTGAGVCFWAVCATIAIVWWTVMSSTLWFNDDEILLGGSALIRCIVLSAVTILCVAVVPIMVTMSYSFHLLDF